MWVIIKSVFLFVIKGIIDLIICDCIFIGKVWIVCDFNIRLNLWCYWVFKVNRLVIK